MDPDFQYRTTPNALPDTSQVYTKDDADQGTLIAVYKDLKKVMEDIDKWHAFDLKNEHSNLTVEQQIVAHQAAYDMLQPALDALESAIALTDEKFKNRS